MVTMVLSQGRRFQSVRPHSPQPSRHCSDTSPRLCLLQGPTHTHTHPHPPLQPPPSILGGLAQGHWPSVLPASGPMRTRALPGPGLHIQNVLAVRVTVMDAGGSTRIYHPNKKSAIHE